MSLKRRRKRPSTRRPLLESLEDRRLLAVDWRNPADSFDVNADYRVTALDALQVINELNRRVLVEGSSDLDTPYPGTGPYVDVNGSGTVSALDALQIINQLNRTVQGDRVIADGDTYAAEQSTFVTLGQPSGLRTYTLEINPSFPASVAGPLRSDVFNVYLTDTENLSRSLIGSSEDREPIFSLTSSDARTMPGVSRWDGRILQIDVSSVNDTDTGRLELQLLNRNGVTDSSVSVRLLENTVDPNKQSVEAIAISNRFSVEGEAVDDVDLLTTSPFRIIEKATSYHRTEKQLNLSLIVEATNTPISRNSVISFPGLPDGISLENASGTTAEGVPYLNLRNAIPAGGLSPSVQSKIFAAKFTGVSRSSFTIDPVLLAGQPNQPPSIEPIGDIVVTPGDFVSVPVVATDADGDRVTLTIQSETPLPTGELTADDRFIFRPTPDEIGTYRFTLLGNDGATTVRQEVRLFVEEDFETTTRIAGVVLNLDQSPIVGMPVELGSFSGFTDEQGRFSIDVGDGPLTADTIRFRGDLLSGDAKYPFVAEKLPLMYGREVFVGMINRMERPVYLPILAAGSTVDPNADTMVSRALSDGETPVEVMVKRNTLFDQQGLPFNGELSITEVPPDLTPAALPDGVLTDVVVTIQPGEMVFSVPAQLSFPNRSNLPPGTALDLLSINPTTGEFDDVGDMVVSADGSVIETVSGGIRNSSWHLPVVPIQVSLTGSEENLTFIDVANVETATCPVCRATEGNFEVELATGAVRSYRSLVQYQSAGRSHGIELSYDSLRANSRRIVEAGFGVLPQGALRWLLDTNRVSTLSIDNSNITLKLKLEVDSDGIAVTQPGYAGGTSILESGEHGWKVPDIDGDTSQISASPFRAAVQANLSAHPSGRVDYSLHSSIATEGGAGSRNTTEDSLYHLNFRNSEFGAGWGMSDLWELVEEEDGSVFLFDGHGHSLLFTVSEIQPELEDDFDPSAPGENGRVVRRYDSPNDDFSVLLKDASGLFTRWLPDDSVQKFGRNNRIESLHRTFYDTLAFRYDESDVISSITDSTGLETRFVNENGKVVRIEHPGNKVTKFEYDEVGNLLQVTDPDETSTRYSYDAQHRILSETDKRGQKETVSYDDLGRAVEGVRKDGSVQRYITNSMVVGTIGGATTNPENLPFVTQRANPAAYVDANGNSRIAGLDSLGQRVVSGDGEGIGARVTRTGSRVTSIVDARGNETEFAYDRFGNPTASSAPVQTDRIIAESSLGNDYWLAFPPTLSDGLVLQLRITGNGVGSGLVEIPASNFQVGYEIVAGETTLVDIPSEFVASTADSIQGRGIHVTSSMPVSVVGVLNNANEGSAGAINAIPTKGLGLEYLTLGWGNSSSTGTSFIVVATEDDTTIRFQLPVDTREFSGTPPEGLTLQKGQTYGLNNLENPNPGGTRDLSGSRIYSDKPIAVFAGHYCARIPTDTGACDLVTEQVPPVEQLGTSFLGIPLAGRTARTVYRILASEDSTELQVDGRALPNRLSRGEFFEWTSTSPVRFETSAPSLVAQYAPGFFADSENGDPLMIYIQPRHLYQNEYFVPASSDTFSENFITILHPPADLRVNGELVAETLIVESTPGVSLVLRQDQTPKIITSASLFGLTFHGFGGEEEGSTKRGYGSNGGRRIPLGPQASTDVAIPFTSYANRAVYNGRDYETNFFDYVGKFYSTHFNYVDLTTDERGFETYIVQDWERDIVTSFRQDGSQFDPTDDRITTIIYDFLGGGSLGTPADLNYGQPDAIIDSLDRRTEFEYDEFGRAIATTFAVGTADEATMRYEYDAVGNQTAIIDENGNRTEFEYSPNNYLTKVTSADPDGDGPLSSQVTQYIRDEEGAVILVIDPRGVGSVALPDELGRVTETAVHPLADQITFGVDPVSGVRTVAFPDDKALRSVNTYDAVGNITSSTDPEGNQTLYQYDARNRLVTTTDPDVGVTRFGYDLDNNMTSLTDPVGNRTEFVYGARNELLEETDPLGKKTRYVYDAAGNLIRKYDRNDRLTIFEYSPFNELVKETWYTSVNDLTVENQLHYRYDNGGNLIETFDNYSHLIYTYDSRDRVKTVDNAGTPGAPNVVLTYSYDAVGNVLSVSDVIDGVGGAVTQYDYDALNRVTSIQQSGNEVSEKVVDFVYNEIGQYDQVLRYSDLARTNLVVETDYEYDELNRLIDLDHTNSADEVLAFFDYVYDDASRITQIADIHGVTDYGYDDRSQLTGADRLETDSRSDESYEYDANGNRISSHLHDSGYETGLANRLLSDGTYDYEYDGEGNTIRRTNIESGEYRIFEWDHRNRLVSVLDHAADDVVTQQVEFEYDTLGRRTLKTVDADGDGAELPTASVFVYDGEDIVFDFAQSIASDESRNVTSTDRYLHGPQTDQILASDGGSLETGRWALTDHLGTVHALTQDNGTVADTFVYDAYGQTIEHDGLANDFLFRFTGREFDTEVDLQNNRARYFAPDIGRFLGEDLISFAAGDPNLYRYVGNRVLNFTDPTGLQSADVVGISARGAVAIGLGLGLQLSIPQLDYESGGCFSFSRFSKHFFDRLLRSQVTASIEILIGLEASVGGVIGTAEASDPNGGTSAVASASGFIGPYGGQISGALVDPTATKLSDSVDVSGTVGLPRAGFGFGTSVGAGVQRTHQPLGGK